MTTVEEIKSKLAIDQVIGEFVTLKQAGTNFKGLCPFHQEKTPSFMVSPEKQIWHCFGCNEGGDIFSFIQKYEGLDFKGAIETLAAKAGVVVRGLRLPDTGKKKVLYELHERARDFYHERLLSAHPQAVKTREYLTARGVTKESIEHWSLGLSPDSWDDLASFLRSKKYADADMVAAGLVIAREQKHFDRFRRRLMFPINDVQGRVVAFTARTLQYIVSTEEDQAGKYVNSPQTPVYNKSQILYGFDKARQEIRRLNYAIIVEGNMDAIMSHQAGIKNAVAVSGTALTLEQLNILKRYTQNIILSFDADTAGSQAVFRGISLAWDHDINVKVVALKEGKDPAEIIQKNPDDWRTAIKESIGVVDFYFEQIFARIDLSRADHKKQAAQKITGIISNLKTKVEQAHYITLLSSRLHIAEDILWSMLQAPKQAAIRQPADEVLPVPESKRSSGFFSGHLISLMAQYPAMVERIINETEPDMIEVSLQDLYKKIIIHYTKGQSANFQEVVSQLNRDELGLWSELVFQGEQVYGSMTPPQLESELSLLLKRIKHVYYTQKLQDVTKAIRVAEHEGDQETVATLMREHQALIKKRTG